MQSFTYLIINFLTIIVCFLFSFHPKIKFNALFKIYYISSTLSAIPNIIWDIVFIQNDVWWFNKTYTLGIDIANLPLEELLFFWCIPFSCTFTYFCLNTFFDFSLLKKFDKIIFELLILFFLVLIFFYYSKIYITVVAISSIAILLFLKMNNSNSITKFSLIYLILMLGFIPVNGVLTGYGLENPIVNYNPKDIIGIRLLTIPLEDIGFGYGLYLLNIYWFEYFLNKEK